MYGPESKAVAMMRKRARYIKGRREEFEIQPRKFENWIDACLAECDGLEVDSLLRAMKKRGWKNG